MNRLVRSLARRFRKTSKRLSRLTGRRAKGATYIERVMDRLDAGKVHASLGPNLKSGSAYRARRTLDRLVERGLQPEHVVVDFGCGTLRIGAPLIDYLGPDRYVGLDLDQRLLDLGLRMLPARLAEEKRPTLRVISPESLAEVAAKKPDWIFSGGVMQHVPPEELGTYFGNISAVATSTTRIEIRVSKMKEVPARLSVNTWSHAMPQIEDAAKIAGLSLTKFKTTNGTEGSLFLAKA